MTPFFFKGLPFRQPQILSPPPTQQSAVRQMKTARKNPFFHKKTPLKQLERDFIKLFAYH